MLRFGGCGLDGLVWGLVWCWGLVSGGLVAVLLLVVVAWLVFWMLWFDGLVIVANGVRCWYLLLGVCLWVFVVVALGACCFVF